MPENPSRIVQISDIHLFADENSSLLGVKTQESFLAVVDSLKKSKHKLDLILITGDLSQDGSEITYQRIADSLNQFNVPIYWTPGNHDNLEVMQHVYPRGCITNEKNIILDGWQIILLDSHIPHKIEGALEKKQYEFLKECITAHPHLNTMIAFHHQPFNIGSMWLDKIGLQHHDQFWDTLKEFPQVKKILFGHIHQQVEGNHNGIDYYSSPSCCIQFKPDCDQFKLDNIPPGYRLIDLYPSGEFKTTVCRLADYIGKYDGDAKGY